MIYTTISNTLRKKKLFSILIDPEEYNEGELIKIINIANICDIDFILVGGSYISSLKIFENTVDFIKGNSDIPVIIFPGNYMQITDKADGILLLNLISGRNPDFLIGQHVLAAQSIKKSRLEVIPTGYILIENGKVTSVEYMSNTKPIPNNEPEIIVSTAIAGEQMGNKLIYLEAGSGAMNPVNTEIIRKVKKNINIPLIVGGGLSDKETIQNVYQAGADIVVVGNALERQPELLTSLSLALR